VQDGQIGAVNDDESGEDKLMVVKSKMAHSPVTEVG